MIVDSPLTFDLTRGVDKRIPAARDAQVEVPAMVMPVALMIQPTRVSNAAVLQQISHIAESQLTRAASQASTSVIVTSLDEGLWELELTMSSWFNFENAQGTFNKNQIDLQYQGFVITGLSRFASVGSFTDYNRLRLLLSSQMDIVLRTGTTGVAQGIDTEITVNAIRIL